MSAHARMTQAFLQDGYCDKPTTPRAVSTGPVHHGVGVGFSRARETVARSTDTSAH